MYGSAEYNFGLRRNARFDKGMRPISVITSSFCYLLIKSIKLYMNITPAQQKTKLSKFDIFQGEGHYLQVIGLRGSSTAWGRFLRLDY